MFFVTFLPQDSMATGNIYSGVFVSIKHFELRRLHLFCTEIITVSRVSTELKITGLD